MSPASFAKLVDRPSKAPPDNRYTSGASQALLRECVRVVLNDVIRVVLIGTVSKCLDIKICVINLDVKIIKRKIHSWIM